MMKMTLRLEIFKKRIKTSTMMKSSNGMTKNMKRTNMTTN